MLLRLCKVWRGFFGVGCFDRLGLLRGLRVPGRAWGFALQVFGPQRWNLGASRVWGFGVCGLRAEQGATRWALLESCGFWG